MTDLIAVDKTGRPRHIQPKYEERGPIVEYEYIAAKVSDASKKRIFKLLVRSKTAAESILDTYRTIVARNNYKEIGIGMRELGTNIKAFTDAVGNEVFFRLDEVVIGFKRRSASDVAKVSVKYGLTILWFDWRGNFGIFRLISTPLAEIFEKLQTEESVLFAEPNILDGADLPAISDLEDEGVPLPNHLIWNHLTLGRDNGGSRSDGSGVVIAVVDTPIDLDHPGFSTSLYLKTHELHFGEAQPIPMSHGTSVASILVDSTPIGLGVPLGLCPGARLLPVSIDTAASSSYAKRAAAINYLAQSFIRREASTQSSGLLPLPRLVVNCSWKVRGDQDLTSVQRAFSWLISSGAICVCSAGNENTDRPHFPSDYEGCLSIAGITRDLEKSRNSNYGRRVSFSLPGGDGTPYGEEDILAACAGSVFDFVSGTSFAAPHAAGVLAALWSRNPSLTGRELVDLARSRYAVSVEPNNPMYVGQLGAGLIRFCTSL